MHTHCKFYCMQGTQCKSFLQIVGNFRNVTSIFFVTDSVKAPVNTKIIQATCWNFKDKPLESTSVAQCMRIPTELISFSHSLVQFLLWLKVERR